MAVKFKCRFCKKVSVDEFAASNNDRRIWCNNCVNKLWKKSHTQSGFRLPLSPTSSFGGSKGYNQKLKGGKQNEKDTDE